MKRSVPALQRVLSCLLDQEQPVTRPSLAEACDLSRPPVFAAVERLEKLGVVEQVGQASGRPGRSPALYQVSIGAGLLAAVDIGGSNVRVALADLRGHVLAETKAATVPGGGARIVEQVIELVTKARTSLSERDQPLTLAAVSVPGVVGTDDSTVIYASNVDQPAPFDFRTPLATRLGCDVVLDNNVNLAAAAERWCGVAKDLDTFAMVAIGAGIGAGIVHDGRVLRGAHGAAGEVAFLPPDGRRRRVDTAAHDDAGGLNLLSRARSRPGWSGELPGTVQEIFARAAVGEEPALSLVEDECVRVATIIASLAAVVDPERVILTGGVGGNDLLIAGAQRHVTEMAIFPPKLVRSALAERASLIGAVHLAAQQSRHRLLAAVAE